MSPRWSCPGDTTISSLASPTSNSASQSWLQQSLVRKCSSAMSTISRLCVCLTLFSIAAFAQQTLAPPPFSSLTLPEGFQIALYTGNALPSARQMTISESPEGAPDGNIVYVGSSGGNVYAVVDRDGTQRNITTVTLLSGLNTPNGVAYQDGSLWVAQVLNVTRYDNVDAAALAGQPLGPGTLISTVFNSQADHALHYIKIGPDNLLYANQGSPSNTGPCPSYGPINLCSIVRMDLNGSNPETYAYGVRNSVGFDWQPGTESMWATTNARDNLDPDHNNRPDDYLMWLPYSGKDFGFPFCHFTGSGDPLDREVGVISATPDDVNYPGGVPQGNNASLTSYCSDPANAAVPAQALGPHVASLGMTFYTGTMFPGYNGTIFNAQHGSWDRDFAIGYRVMNIGVSEDGQATSYSMFANGWLNTTLAPSGANAWGRPVDVLQMPDGAILVSDDQLGALYRISYTTPTVATQSVAG